MSLKIDRVSKSFDGRSPVLGDVSLSDEDGEFLALLGPSGSGKTTLLNIISGLTAPDSGRLVLNGEDITSVPPFRHGVPELRIVSPYVGRRQYRLRASRHGSFRAPLQG